MNEGLISKRYARALFDYAAERGEDKLLYERMRVLVRSISTVPLLRETLGNPILGYADKERLITEAAGGSVEESFRRFVTLVLENHRETLLQYIAYSFMAIYRRVHRIVVVELTSADPLSEIALERIRTGVENRTRSVVEFDIRVDPSIEGGVIFQLDDLRLDASIKGQLERVRQQFIQKNKTIV